METRYYYYRDWNHRPLITLAMVTDEHGDVGYGWAVTSPLDNPCKRIGKSIARARAIAALHGYGIHLEHESDGGNILLWDRPVERFEVELVASRCVNGGDFRAFIASSDGETYLEPLLPVSLRVSQRQG